MPRWNADTEDIASEYDEEHDDWDDEENDKSAVSDGNAITAEKFYKAIRGYGQKIENTSSMILLSFDAATPGRLSMVEEATLDSAKYLENIKKWLHGAEVISGESSFPPQLLFGTRSSLAMPRLAI